MTRSAASQIKEILLNLIVAMVLIDGLVVIIAGILTVGAIAVVANRALSAWRFVRASGWRPLHV